MGMVLSGMGGLAKAQPSLAENRLGAGDWVRGYPAGR